MRTMVGITAFALAALLAALLWRFEPVQYGWIIDRRDEHAIAAAKVFPAWDADRGTPVMKPGKGDRADHIRGWHPPK